MLHFLRAGPDLVRWELTEVARGGPCRLAVHHSQVTIVEYCATATKALMRVQELEELLVRARWFDDQVPAGFPS
jgi:hypothetical protein